ncbi:hypothetical protein GALMADRAFT_19375, partial [Galerina marginata CBS 339.88]
MPIPGSRDAPKFDEDQPSELLRFISRIEDLYKANKIEGDPEKKKLLGKYATAVTESEWQAFSSYKEGRTWEDYKKEIIKSYPEAAALETGSLERLEKIIRAKGGGRRIREENLEELLSLKRSFCAEAAKLLTPPAL